MNKMDKLTDAEIIKAFQMCTLKAEHPGFILCGQIVDLIKHLQAEIEKLKDYANKLMFDMNDEEYKTLQDEFENKYVTNKSFIYV